MAVKVGHQENACIAVVSDRAPLVHFEDGGLHMKPVYNFANTPANASAQNTTHAYAFMELLAAGTANPLNIKEIAAQLNDMKHFEAGKQYGIFGLLLEAFVGANMKMHPSDPDFDATTKVDAAYHIVNMNDAPKDSGCSFMLRFADSSVVKIGITQKFWRSKAAACARMKWAYGNANRKFLCVLWSLGIGTEADRLKK